MYTTPARSRHYVPIQSRDYLLLAPQKHNKYTLSSSRQKNSASRQKRQSSINKSTSIKAYHFSDSIYQGQMKNFQRVGKGILLHDDGLCGIIQSGTNRLKGHNIFFGQNMIISAIYQEHALDFVCKIGKNILIISMFKQGSKIGLNSTGYLIEYQVQRVSKLRFKEDILKQKVALTKAQHDQIIKNQNLSKIMKQQHVKALNFDIFDNRFPQIQANRIYHNQIHIGFVNPNQNQFQSSYNYSYGIQKYLLNGLGFIIQKTNQNPARMYQYEFRILERGFFNDGKLQYFGQQYYDNGNFYFGSIKDQKMHGKGILVYMNQSRFAYGTFHQGKPVKIQQKRQYRLDTEQGIALYLSIRKRLHNQDLQIYIDGKIADLLDYNYFKNKLNQCIYFLCEDQQHKNFLKQQDQLKLSRKVQDFQNKYDATKPASLITFGRKFTGPLIQTTGYDLQNQIKRRLFDHSSSQNHNRSTELNLKQFDPKFSLDGIPISKRSGEISPNKLQESIIKGLRFTNQKQHSQYCHKAPQIIDPNSRINSLIGGNIINSDIFAANSSRRSSKSPKQPINYDDSFQKYQLYQPQFGVNKPLNNPFSTNKRLDELGERQRRSKSRQKQGRRLSPRSKSIQKRNELQNQSYNMNINSPNQNYIENSSPVRKLFSDANLRAERLQQQYKKIQQEYNKNRQSNMKPSTFNTKKYQQPYTFKPINIRQNLNNKNYRQTSPSKRVSDDGLLQYHIQKHKQSRNNTTSHQLPDYVQQVYEIEDKYKQAGDQAIMIGHLNKVKEQKVINMDHVTHKKHFDYTNEPEDLAYSKTFQNINILKQQTAYKRPTIDKTPQKQAKYYANITANNTVRKQQVYGAINRLYPHGQNYLNNSNSFTNNKYDSSIDQNKPLNSYGRTYDPRQYKSRQQYSQSRYLYGTDHKNTFIKNNAISKN